MKKDKSKSIIPVLLVVFIFISIIAGVFDTYFYGELLSTKGISRWSLKLVNPQYILEYLTSSVGATLTILSLSPWLFLLAIVYWPEAFHKKNRL